MNCAKNILLIVIIGSYHLIWEYQRLRQSSKSSVESCPNKKKTRPLWHEFFIVSIFILYTLFISVYLLNGVHSITEIQLVEMYPVGLYHLLNFFFSEVFNDFNCCSCKSLSLTLDNARLPLQNLCTNLTQVHLYANFQEGKIALLTPWEQSAFICYLLTAPHIKCFKNPLKQNQMFTEILTSVQIKLSSSLPPNSLYPLNNALKWKYRACNDWQN